MIIILDAALHGNAFLRQPERGPARWFMFKRSYFLAFLLLWLCAPVTAAEPSSSAAYFEAGFSPYGRAEEIILRGINQAEVSIQVAAYSFTSKPISLALLAAHKRGVNVRVIADEKSSAGRYSAVTFLANQGVQVRSNGNYMIFHHKFMLVDNRHVQTGSFNFSSAAANRNAENVLMLWNVPEIAAHYNREWQRLWDESNEIKAGY